MLVRAELDRRASRLELWLLPVAAVLVVLLLRIVLAPMIGAASPFLMFVLAVAICAWRGGFWPGTLATTLGGIAAAVFVLPLHDGPPLGTAIERVQVALFLAVGLVVSALAESVLREQRARERLLREVEAERTRLAEVLRQAPSFMAILRGPDHIYERQNDLHAELIGYRDIIGKPVRTALPELESQSILPLLDRVYRTGEPFVASGMSVRLKRTPDQPPEERFLDFVYQPLRDADDSVIGILVQGVDQTELRRSEQRFHLMIESVRDYGIFMLDQSGHVSSWNSGAERIKGYKAAEIVGKHFSIFYTEADQRRGQPEAVLQTTETTGASNEEGYRVRKDGSRFWASVVMTAMRDTHGRLVGFAKVTRDLTERRLQEQKLMELNAQLERRVTERTAALEATNRELEAFSYSVSHDLRAPLRGVDGFAKILLKQYAESFDEQGRHYLERIRSGTQRMGALIDDLLQLSRLTRAELRAVDVDLGTLAREVLEELRKADPERQVELSVAEPVRTRGDPRLLRVLLENLLGNAWKFTSKTPHPRIEFGETSQGEQRVFFVRDNGAGFDMQYATKLFTAFQRLHHADDFEGTGIGLATVQRIVARHGGRVWAEAQPDHGATFSFTLGEVFP